MDIKTLEPKIQQLAERAIIAGLRDTPDYAERANAYISGWLWMQHMEASEDNVYQVREVFDAHCQECLAQLH